MTLSLTDRAVQSIFMLSVQSQTVMLLILFVMLLILIAETSKREELTVSNGGWLGRPQLILQATYLAPLFFNCSFQLFHFANPQTFNSY